MISGLETIEQEHVKDVLFLSSPLGFHSIDYLEVEILFLMLLNFETDYS